MANETVIYAIQTFWDYDTLTYLIFSAPLTEKEKQKIRNYFENEEYNNNGTEGIFNITSKFISEIEANDIIYVQM